MGDAGDPSSRRRLGIGAIVVLVIAALAVTVAIGILRGAVAPIYEVVVDAPAVTATPEAVELYELVRFLAPSGDPIRPTAFSRPVTRAVHDASRRRGVPLRNCLVLSPASPTSQTRLADQPLSPRRCTGADDCGGPTLRLIDRRVALPVRWMRVPQARRSPIPRCRPGRRCRVGGGGLASSPPRRGGRSSVAELIPH